MPEELDPSEIDPELIADPAEPEPTPFSLPEDFASQVESWGVPVDELAQAAAFHKSLQTQDGVIEAFIQTGQSLGFGIKELNRLFEDEPAPAPVTPAPTPHEEPLDPERLMTAAEVDALLDKVRAETTEFRQQQEQREQEAQQRTVFNAMDQWFDGQGVPDMETRRQIAAFGEKHVVGNSYDPAVAIRALEAGKAEYDAWIDGQARAYLQRKAAAAGKQPTPVGGAVGHAGGSDEPPFTYEGQGRTAMDAAKQRVRDRLRQSGELG